MDLELKNNISIIRRDRNSRGGGVGIAFDKSRSTFAKIKLKSLVKSGLEILPVSGKVHGFKRVHVIFSCYIPPSYNALDNARFFDKLADAVSEARTKFPEAWITVGGDWNRRDLKPVLDVFPDLKLIASCQDPL